jgi:3'-phosphoadenosine 5'-phosphosulfate (PAPS) 3'-phosphatase
MSEESDHCGNQIGTSPIMEFYRKNRRQFLPASGQLRWIIDPLDGTTNYAHGYPVFCVSIALEKDGAVVLGADL